MGLLRRRVQGLGDELLGVAGFVRSGLVVLQVGEEQEGAVLAVGLRHCPSLYGGQILFPAAFGIGSQIVVAVIGSVHACFGSCLRGVDRLLVRCPWRLIDVRTYASRRSPPKDESLCLRTCCLLGSLGLVCIFGSRCARGHLLA